MSVQLSCQVLVEACGCESQPIHQCTGIGMNHEELISKILEMRSLEAVQSGFVSLCIYSHALNKLVTVDKGTIL